MSLKERFLKYVAIDTGSSEESGQHPSTAKQWELAKLLKEELEEMGAANVRLSETCYVYAEIPANCENQPVIGLIAHMDTAPAVATGPVHARALVYQGGDIELGNGVWLKPDEYESLNRHVGHELIVTDGTTLLGGDNKAGVAEIMELAKRLIDHPEIPHGKVCIGFTPDEEIGEGADHFDVSGFGADFAYTVDGGALGEVECETFNAAAARITVHGFNIHPGAAKNKMRNAAKIAMQFAGMLPPAEAPEHTEGREGFYHLCSMKGDETEAQLVYIIRDHDRGIFEQRKARMQAIGAYLNGLYGEGTVAVELRDSYYNMKQEVDKHPHVMQRALDAMQACGIEPIVSPVRGGTDGARLSYMGLPCPNLSTGGYNFHGVMEYVSLPEMEKMVDVLEAVVRAR
ncbi:MAG: peptidase T [Clostridiales bacterium]|nr:peptidase T [Clostridiales bacterium]